MKLFIVVSFVTKSAHFIANINFKVLAKFGFLLRGFGKTVLKHKY